MAKYKVLSTKKLESSLVEKAGEAGIEMIEQEFISINPLRNKETYQKILSFPERDLFTAAITSSHAVNILNDYMAFEDKCCVIAWKLFCIEGKTKNTIREAPFLSHSIIAGEAASGTLLADEIIKQDVTEIIFFCGNKRRDELPLKLRDAGVIVHEVVLYETIETPIRLKEDVDAVIFFSPSGVQSFFTLNELKPNTACFSIGPTTTSSIRSFTGNPVIAGTSPDPVEIVNNVIEHFKHKPAAG